MEWDGGMQMKTAILLGIAVLGIIFFMVSPRWLNPPRSGPDA